VWIVGASFRLESPPQMRRLPIFRYFAVSPFHVFVPI
jgi:hypothetical protein